MHMQYVFAAPCPHVLEAYHGTSKLIQRRKPVHPLSIIDAIRTMYDEHRDELKEVHLLHTFDAHIPEIDAFTVVDQLVDPNMKRTDLKGVLKTAYEILESRVSKNRHMGGFVIPMPDRMEYTQIGREVRNKVKSAHKSHLPKRTYSVTSLDSVYTQCEARMLYTMPSGNPYIIDWAAHLSNVSEDHVGYNNLIMLGVRDADRSAANEFYMDAHIVIMRADIFKPLDIVSPFEVPNEDVI